MKRLFVAIKLKPDENFLETYNFLKTNLKQDLIKWVKPDVMHLTLKFLGPTPNEDISKIKYVLENFSKKKSPLNFEFDKTGIFGSSYDPRVIWFGITNNEEIKSFGEDLLNLFHENGFKRDRQNFVPHLTIGRIKKINNKRYFQNIIDKVKDKKIQSFYVNEIILYQSILKPDGPVYIELGKYNLVGSKE